MKSDQEEQDSLNRREMMSNSFLASLALTAGFVGAATITQADPMPKGKVPPKFYKPPVKQKPVLVNSVAKVPLNEQLAKLKAEIKGMIAQNLQLSSRHTLGIIDNKKLQRIESSVVLDENNIAVISKSFQYTNVETLLDQANSLLERGLKDRAEWDDKAIKNLTLALELHEFFELDDIHKSETDKGYYDQDVQTLQNQLNTELVNKSNLELISKYFDDMFKYRWTSAMQSIIGETYAEISRLSNLREKNDQSQAIHDKTRYVVEHSQAIQFVNNFIQDNGYLNALELSRQKCINLQQRLDWEINNRTFSMQRTDTTRKYKYLKALSSQYNDGLLNYNKRMHPLLERFNNDFNEAYGRLAVAAIGLKKIYGFSVALPKPSNHVDFFDNCVVWNRNAINTLVKFSRLDQSYVLPISLRSLIDQKMYSYYSIQEEVDNIPNTSWGEFLKLGKFNFTLDESLFSNQKHVRVRGLSLFVSITPYKGKKHYLNKINGTITADVTIPATSRYIHLDGHVENVDQSILPKLRIGRVSTRDFARAPEICGTSTYFNASPLGEWSLTIPQIEKGNLNDFVYLEDIYLDLFVTMRTGR